MNENSPAGICNILFRKSFITDIPFMQSFIRHFQTCLFPAIIIFSLSCSLDSNQRKVTTTDSKTPPKKGLQTGDIVFQTSLSGQSKAIQLATHSEWSHCGVVFEKEGQLFVFEAVQPVKMTLLDAWIKRGKNRSFKAKRLANADQILNEKVLDKMDRIRISWLGKKYDGLFNWADAELYCSELVWKLFHESTGIETGKLQQLRDFDLSSVQVRKKLNERYGNRLPLDEWVISPDAVFHSETLVDVP